MMFTLRALQLITLSMNLEKALVELPYHYNIFPGDSFSGFQTTPNIDNPSVEVQKQSSRGVQ